MLLEYDGCFCHGYSKCYSVDAKNLQKCQKMSELQDQFLDKIRDLEKEEYKVEVIWGCEFQELKMSLCISNMKLKS